MIAIIDYGQGNLKSVSAACRAVGLNAIVASSEAQIWSADAAILPGVGAFPTAKMTLERRGMETAIRRLVARGAPLLGICLGMQLLFGQSEENGGADGLGFIPGVVRPLPESPTLNVGWRNVRPASSWDGTLLGSTEPGERFYFCHGYACHPNDPADWLAVSDWGTYVDPYCRGEICAAVRKDNIIGVQFHPEKSGPAGLQVFRQFKAMLDGDRRAA